MRKNVYAAAAIALAVAVAPACASKKFVRTEVGTANGRIDSLGRSIEETQERTRENEARIGVVDGKSDAAGRTANEARMAAGDARSAADAAAGESKEVDARLSGRVNDVETASHRLIFEVTLSQNQGNFKFGGAALPTEAKARLDEMIKQLTMDPKTVFIEIEGYTDNVGPAVYNEQLGLDRAETVKRYLHEQFQMPLHKMNVISYGAEKPVASNTTSAGRALNRRVVVRVLS